MSTTKPTLLMTVWKATEMVARGMKPRQVARRLGISPATVYRIIGGQDAAGCRRIADRMETFFGGVIAGDGNSHNGRATGLYFENGGIVGRAPDTLDVLLAEELIRLRLEDGDPVAGHTNIPTEAEPPTETYVEADGGTVYRADTWEQHLEAVRADRPDLLEYLVIPVALKRAEAEGQYTDVWSVRDMTLACWGTKP